MKRFFFSTILAFTYLLSTAQNALDTSDGGTAVIIKDARIAILESKLAAYNNTLANANKVGGKEVTHTSSTGIVLTQGYRLMVISSSDRDLAIRVRAKLYQTFPDQKQYMEFQMPNTKIKFGNFLDRGQADRVRKQIMSMKLVPNNIYVISSMVEMKVEKKDPNAKDDNGETKKAVDTKKKLKAAPKVTIKKQAKQ
jgi:hypothetical protein